MKRNLILLLLLPFSALAQQNYPKLIDSYMTAQVNINKFNGNVLVARSGKVIYQKAFGYRNYDTKELLDNNSMFELASLSKQFTAMGIMMLNDQGKLKLTDPLQKYFPELPYTGITLQNLLTHTSGLPAYEDEMAPKWDHKKIAFNKDMIQFLATEKPAAKFAPGKKWEYSNTAYAILASIIEKVSGQSYADFMRQRIFKPLGMTRSRVYNTRRSSGERIADYAYGFVNSDSLKRYVSPDSLKDYDLVYYLDGIVGDGTINSTTGDLLKWEQALQHHTLLTVASQQAMLSPQSLMDTVNRSYYAYGNMIMNNELGQVFTHSGGWPGYATNLSRYVAKDITIIILSNNESSSPAIDRGLGLLLFDKPVVFPYIHQEVKIDTNVLNNYLGTFTSISGNIAFIKKDGYLYRHRAGVPDVMLKPESDRKFFYADKSDRQVEFETDNYGKMIKCWIIAGGAKSELHKL